MANSIIEQLELIEKEIAEIKSKRDKATGRYDAAMAALVSLGYETIEDATAAIAEREEKLNSRAEQLSKDFNAFLAQYDEVIADDQP